MKRKKRRPCSNGSRIVENYGSATEKRTHGDFSQDGNRMDILTILDELDGYLSSKTPEINRVRIPNCGAFRWSSLGFVDDTNLNPKLCLDDVGLERWDQKLILSREALKEPRQDFVEGFEKLLEMKFGIMALRIRHGLDAWSLGSHMVNPFEVLSYVAAKSTLNRAFFKMWELVQTFQLVPSVSQNRRFLSAHLCEGPGGFIEAILEFRARSRSISDFPEGNHREPTCVRAFDHEELHSKDPPPLSARRNCGSAHPSSLNLSNGIEDSRCLSTAISNTSGAPQIGPKTCASTEFNNGSWAGPKARSGSVYAAERSRGQLGNDGIEDSRCMSTTMSSTFGAPQSGPKTCSSIEFGDGNWASSKARSGSAYSAERSRGQLGNSTLVSGVSRPQKVLNNCSNTQSGAQLREFLDRNLDRVDPRDVEDEFLDRNLNRVDSRDAGDEHLDRNLDRVDSRDVDDASLDSNLDRVDSRDVEDGFLDSKLDRVDSRDVEDGSFGKTSMNYHDLWFGLTLAATQQQCATGGSAPPMIEMTRLNEKVAGFRDSSQGHLHFGVDGSGDLTNPANVNAFVEYTLGQSDGQKMDLITADGAFDVSEDFSSQEHSHLHLVFCEVVAALRLQAEGGSFVLKLFDCYTASTLTILSILSSVYKNVEIVRLRTTRICNSERYVVAESFLGLSPQLEKILLRLNEEWSLASMRGEKVGLLLSGGFSEQLLQALQESNAAIAAVQIDGINRALQLADVIGERLPTAENSFGKRKGFIGMLRRKLQTHKRMQRNAVALCYALNIPCRLQFCMEKEAFV